MNTHIDKKIENKGHSVVQRPFQRDVNSDSSFQFIDNRPEAIAQRKLREIINNSPRSKLTIQTQMKSNNVIQKTDFFDLVDKFEPERSKEGPLPILRKTGDGYAFDENFLVEKVQLRGGHGKAHSEVFCIIFRSRYNKGVLRFSRNQGGDTFQRQAQLDRSNWPVSQEINIFPKRLTVKGAESLAEKVHNTMTHYISGDCHDFAYSLYTALSTGSIPVRVEDSFF